MLWRAGAVVLLCTVAMLGCGKEETPGKQVAQAPSSRDGGQPEESAAVQDPDVDVEHPVIPGQGVGAVVFGMTEDEVVSHLGEPELRADGGLSLVYPSKGLSVTVHPDLGVRGVMLSSASALPPDLTPGDFAGTSSAGIGIGSSEAEVLAAYGEAQQRRQTGRQTDTLYEEPRMRLLFLEGRLIQWTLYAPRPLRPERES